MPLFPTWSDILVRLALTVIAGLVLGTDRTERGRVAGMRTMVLICLAASVSMIQVNLLLPLAGRPADSLVMLDLMRLPLGILTGVGFIGAGAILRRGDIIQGVTTAATIWIATVIGLCLGAGELGLGSAALGVSIVVLWGLRRFESMLRQDRRATLSLTLRGSDPSEATVREAITSAGFRIGSWDVTRRRRGEEMSITIRTELVWHGRLNETQPPPFLKRFETDPGVLKLRWSA
jgi:putative Mg2+ transporter-C (MgtC) family protein